MTQARCARCNRVLKDPKSIAAGVGPTCAGKVPKPGVTAGGNGSRPAEDRAVVEFVPPAPAPATGACTIVKTEDQMIHVPLSRIDPNPWQTRRGFDDDYVNELAADIEGRKASRPATLGLLQVPAGRLVDADGQRVTPQSDNWVAQRIQEDGYRVQLVYGHNRFEAFKRLAGTDADYGLMPLSIVAFGDEEMATSAWAENAQRKDLSPVEEAWAIQRMMDSFDWTQEQVGQQLGMGRSTVANKTRLLKLPEDVQGAIHDGRISERQGIAFLPALDIKPHEMDGAHLAKNADFGYWQAPTPNALRQRLVEKGDLTADQVRTAVEKTKEAVERAKKDRWEREQAAKLDRERQQPAAGPLRCPECGLSRLCQKETSAAGRSIGKGVRVECQECGHTWWSNEKDAWLLPASADGVALKKRSPLVCHNGNCQSRNLSLMSVSAGTHFVRCDDCRLVFTEDDPRARDLPKATRYIDSRERSSFAPDLKLNQPVDVSPKLIVEIHIEQVCGDDGAYRPGGFTLSIGQNGAQTRFHEGKFDELTRTLHDAVGEYFGGD